MAVEGTKIREMMEGKTLEKDNIKKMYDMVQNASEPEDKKKVMKHSVFFIGQLPLKENHIVDLEQTRRIVNGSGYLHGLFAERAIYTEASFRERRWFL